MISNYVWLLAIIWLPSAKSHSLNMLKVKIWYETLGDPPTPKGFTM